MHLQCEPVAQNCFWIYIFQFLLISWSYEFPRNCWRDVILRILNLSKLYRFQQLPSPHFQRPIDFADGKFLCSVIICGLVGRKQGKGQVITSYRYCGVQLLLPTLDTCFWETCPHMLLIFRCTPNIWHMECYDFHGWWRDIITYGIDISLLCLEFANPVLSGPDGICQKYMIG